MIEFDQYVEYVTEGPVIHAVELEQHAVSAQLTIEAVVSGYKHLARLARPILPANAELALVFVEWTPETGLPDAQGVVAKALLAGWTAKSIAAAYVVATKATLDAINASRTVAIALIRLALVNGDANPLAPSEPFTAAQVTALATWLNQHNITNAEFAALFDVTALQLSAWLQGHPRWEFAQQIHTRW